MLGVMRIVMGLVARDKHDRRSWGSALDSISTCLVSNVHAFGASVLLLVPLLLLPTLAAADCIPACNGKSCGPDGCGDTCGDCAGGICVGGKCLTDCSLVPEEGCCSDEKLVRCLGQSPVISDCEGMPKCGWSNWWHSYACGTEGEPEGSGGFPMPCVVDCDLNCLENQCGPNGCGGVCGYCDAGQICHDGTCCSPSCSDAACGSDGCGGSCGDCSGGQVCWQGSCCAPNCEFSSCGPDDCGGTCGQCEVGLCVGGNCVSSCSGVGAAGCCHQGDVFKCGGNKLMKIDCSVKPQCGWKTLPGSDIGYYDCGTDGNEAPTGLPPMECLFECEPNCDGKECGLDGCGGSCGECEPEGICIGGSCCVPDCSGKECGDDGCGGLCGYCPLDKQQLCEDGLCVPALGCAATSTPGCPGCSCEECVCEFSPTCCLLEWDWGCTFLCEHDCGGCIPCSPSCDFKECGSDGCGGSCGSCDAGHWCSDGSCCEQLCEDSECGADGCGGSCGECESGEVCSPEQTCEQEWGCAATASAGCGACACEACACSLDPYCCSVEWDWICVEYCNEQCGGCGAAGCTPGCSAKDCGPDGCGGICGECLEGEVCHSWQCCLPDCKNNCGGSDGCGGTCGPGCELGSFCSEGECVSLCFDECEGLQCGQGKCGGWCTPTGGCDDPGQVCVEGKCYNDCAGIPPDIGCCDGEISFSCECHYSDYFGEFQCELQTKKCWDLSSPSQCGWQPDYQDSQFGGAYQCGGSGVVPEGLVGEQCFFSCIGPTCTGKECGPDGCGGQCGNCTEGSVCSDGLCCQQDCEGKECGPDGCGGFCGECPPGNSCNTDFVCEVCESPCEEKECGPDGCGGYCGTCAEGEVCAAGKCLLECAGISEQGCCFGDLLVFCWNSSVTTIKCGPGLNYCGWNPQSQWYDCATDGGADPTGSYPMACWEECFPACWWKQCGPDGCGGSCGDCDSGEACVGGECVSEADDPSVEPFPDVVEQPPEDLMPESVEFEILELEKDTAETVSEGDVRVEGNPDAGHEVFFEAGPEAEGEPGPSCSCRIQGTRSSDGGPGGLLWIALLLLGLLSLRRAKPNQVQRTTAK